MKALSLEFYKFRRRRIFLIITIFLLIEILWMGIVTGKSVSRNPDYAIWELPIITLCSMNGLFLPILTAICVSRIADMEHKGNTWKMLLSLSVKPAELYRAKYISASIIMLWVCVLQMLSIIIVGILNDFKQPIPLHLLSQFLIGTALTNMVIIGLQQWISMAIKNQAFALTLGMIGGFIGMTADLLPQQVGRLFVWSYYAKLSPIAQSFTNERMNFMVRDINSLLPMMGVLIVLVVGIYLAGSIHVSRQEV
ncbi:MAG: ABC transporter permease subunit [Tissierellia bacterium]|nr:ABC transporter permease subunit [Tissierellia bacterium]